MSSNVPEKDHWFYKNFIEMSERCGALPIYVEAVFCEFSQLCYSTISCVFQLATPQVGQLAAKRMSTSATNISPTLSLGEYYCNIIKQQISLQVSTIRSHDSNVDV